MPVLQRENVSENHKTCDMGTLSRLVARKHGMKLENVFNKNFLYGKIWKRRTRNERE